MKLGIQTCTLDVTGYGRWGEKTYEKLREHGYSCSDFCIADTDTIIYAGTQAESDAVILREKELAAQAGIEITQVHGPWRWPPLESTEEGRRERMEKMQKSIRATALLGCKNWVIHPIMPFGVSELGTEDAPKTWEMNLAFMQELLQTAKEYDVTICLENMPMLKFSMAKPAEILRFVQTIHDDHFKICLDTGHVNVFSELDISEEVRRLGSEIRVLHVHDNKYGTDAHFMPRFGTLDWDKFAIALRDIGYTGSFSMETMPPKMLADGIFEELCHVQVKLARDILAGAGL